MELSIQLQALTVSFVYGILFSYLIKLQYRYLFESKLYYKTKLLFYQQNKMTSFVSLQKDVNYFFLVFNNLTPNKYPKIIKSKK